MEDLLGDGTERVIGMSLSQEFRSTGARRASIHALQPQSPLMNTRTNGSKTQRRNSIKTQRVIQGTGCAPPNSLYRKGNPDRTKTLNQNCTQFPCDPMRCCQYLETLVIVIGRVEVNRGKGKNMIRGRELQHTQYKYPYKELTTKNNRTHYYSRNFLSRNCRFRRLVITGSGILYSHSIPNYLLYIVYSSFLYDVAV